MKKLYKAFESLIDPFPSVTKKPPLNSLFYFCFHYIHGIKFYLVLMAFFTMLIAIMETSLFAFLGKVVDWLTIEDPTNLIVNHGNELFNWGLMILILFPTVMFLHLLIFQQCLNENFLTRVRWQLHGLLLGKNLSFFQNDLSGRISTKLMQTSFSVRQTIIKCLDTLIQITIYFIGIVIVIAHADLFLLAPLALWFVIYSYLLFKYIPQLRNTSRNMAHANSVMVGRIVDIYTNITTVKLFTHSKVEMDYSKEGMKLYLDKRYNYRRLLTSLIGLISLNNYILIFTVTFISIYFSTLTIVTAGEVATAIGLIIRLHGLSYSAMQGLSEIYEHIGIVQDGISLISKPCTETNEVLGKSLNVKNGEIRLDNISFHYNRGMDVIENFSLTINPGEKVGLVGRSGAGKSTLINLLLRFYDVQKGRILIDGQDISKVNQNSLRENIAMVTQDISLFHRSIRENISYGKLNATEEDVIAAAKHANAHEFITKLTDSHNRKGYDAHVGERGIKLSGGQRQRIAIARVLLKNAPILILDEATSALDSEAEIAIRENLHTLMHGKTVITVAHRLSTISSMDRLVVIDKGKIIEDGTHKDLLKNNQLYSRLWSLQVNGFLAKEIGLPCDN